MLEFLTDLAGFVGEIVERIDEFLCDRRDRPEAGTHPPDVRPEPVVERRFDPAEVTVLCACQFGGTFA